jgi:AcrR family transcriptional regulator
VARGKGDTLERLYEAAVELIGEQGYAGTTVDEIVDRAGVAKGTVYYHFKGKAALVSALLEDGLARLAASFQSEIEGTSGPEEALRALVHAELAYIKRYQAFSKRYAAVFVGVLADGVASGAFRPELDIQATASTIFGMVATAALDWLVFTPQKALSDVETSLSALVMGAVKAA